MTASLRTFSLAIFYCLIVPVAPSAQTVAPGLPLVTNYSTLDYKAGMQNGDILQDTRGLLYVANNFGLLEYDGTQWATYPVKNGTKVRSVACDGRGRIYVGCQGDFGFFFPDVKGVLRYTSLADRLDPADRDFDEAWSVYVDHDKVYFCTFSNIYVYSRDEFHVVRPSDGIDHSYLVNRQLYVNQPLAGLGLLSGSGIKIIPGGEFFAGTSISGIVPLHQDRMLISTFQAGIFEYRPDGTLTAWNADLQEFFQQSIVNCVVRLRNGGFAIGTQYNGLLITDQSGNLELQLTRGRGIQTRTVMSIYEDDLNNLWVGQNNGIAYVETGSPFTFINEQVGLPGSGYTAFLDEDRLYLGTNTGVYLQGNDGEYKLIKATRGQVYSLAKYNTDLLAGHHNGTFRIEGSAATRISGEPGSWTFLSLAGDHTRLVGGNYSGLQFFHLRNGHWEAGKKLAGFGESSRVMAQDRRGDVWVTHGYKGAFRVALDADSDRVGSVSFYGVDKGFPSHLLINVFPVSNELVFTSQHGLFKYDPSTDRFVPHHLLNRYLGEENVVWFLKEDALGNVYFISKDGIGVLRKNAVGGYVMDTNGFSKLRNYLNDDLQNISVLANHQVLYGAKDGFILYNPFVAHSPKRQFETWIRNVSTDTIVFAGNYTEQDSVIGYQTETLRPVFPYASNSLSFTFSSGSFESGDDIRYQYYLENYESTWSGWTFQTQKEYTNLKEGKYTFHVRARDIDGQLSNVASYGFSIRPPWYRSLWAYVLYSLSGLSLLFTAFRVIDRKYQREQALLEERQRRELYRKESELEQLSQQTQEEITRLQHEKLESELRHMNNELGTSTMHLLNKNEFITGVKATLDHLARRIGQGELKDELHQISRNIEQNISADADWEHFQFHFDRVHGDFSNRFKSAFPTLSPQEIRLSAYLRMNLSSKEIAQLLNISVRGVEISRYRLRKKLRLERGKNLQEFILNF